MFPSFSELFNEFVAKFKQAKPEVDPTVKGSWSFAFGRGVSAIGYSLVILGKELLKQFNPLTATGLFLKLWASYDNISRLGASPSIGTINVYGVNGTAIPGGNFWAGQINGLLYTNTSPTTIQVQDVDQIPVAILTLTRSGTTVTATCSFAHGLETGRFVTISGVDQSDYNGNFAVVADLADVFVFTYEIVGTPTTPATGSPFSAIPIRTITSITEDSGIASATTDFDHIFVDQQYVSISDSLPVIYNDLFLITVTGAKTFTFAITPATGPATSTPAGLVRSVHATISVQSSDNGPETIVTSDGLLDLQDAITNVDTTGKTVGGLQGGAVIESDDALRARMLLSRSSVAGVFTNDQIELAARLINGNTDVFIKNPNTVTLPISDPNAIFPGQVKIYILRKNDPTGPIPTGGILEATKLSIVVNAGLPADVWIEDIFVLAPELRPVSFVLTNVLPDTATMRSAIKSQFEAYFDDEAILGENLDNNILIGVLVETQDLSSGIPEGSFIKRFNWTNIKITYRATASNNGGLVVFTFTSGPTPTNGEPVIISGMAEASYNGTFTIVNATTTTFEIGVAYVADDSGNFTIESEVIAGASLPVLGTLTVNGQVVS